MKCNRCLTICTVWFEDMEKGHPIWSMMVRAGDNLAET